MTESGILILPVDSGYTEHPGAPNSLGRQLVVQGQIQNGATVTSRPARPTTTPARGREAPRNGADINTRTRSNGGRGQVAPCQLRAAGRPSHACAHVALTHAHTHAQAGDQATRRPPQIRDTTRPDPTGATNSRQTPLAVCCIAFCSSFIHGTCMRLQARPVPLGHDMTSSRFACELVSSRQQSQRLPENLESPSHNKHPTNPTTPHLTSPRLAPPRLAPLRLAPSLPLSYSRTVSLPGLCLGPALGPYREFGLLLPRVPRQSSLVTTWTPAFFPLLPCWPGPGPGPPCPTKQVGGRYM